MSVMAAAPALVPATPAPASRGIGVHPPRRSPKILVKRNLVATVKKTPLTPARIAIVWRLPASARWFTFRCITFAGSQLQRKGGGILSLLPGVFRVAVVSIATAVCSIFTPSQLQKTPQNQAGSRSCPQLRR